MRIVARRTLREFWERHAAAEQPVTGLVPRCAKGGLAFSCGRKARLREREHVGENRIVFNVGGNKYRLVVAVNYPYRMCYVRFVGTHQAYDRIDVATCEGDNADSPD